MPAGIAAPCPNGYNGGWNPTVDPAEFDKKFVFPKFVFPKFDDELNELNVQITSADVLCKFTASPTREFEPEPEQTVWGKSSSTSTTSLLAAIEADYLSPRKVRGNKSGSVTITITNQ